MRFTKIILAAGISAASYGLYAWLRPAPPAPSPAAAAVAAKTDEHPDKRTQAVAEMARFLEAAPRQQLGSILKVKTEAVAAGPPAWLKLVQYTKRAENGNAIAQIIADDNPFGAAADERRKLMENPVRSSEDVREVLTELPDGLVAERARLLELLGDLSPGIDDKTEIEAVLLKETQRTTENPQLPAGASLPQAVALQMYYRMEHDGARKYAAYEAAYEAQSDPALKAVLRKFAVPAPADPGRRVPAAVTGQEAFAPAQPAAPAEASNPPAADAAAADGSQPAGAAPGDTPPAADRVDPPAEPPRADDDRAARDSDPVAPPADENRDH